jgi:hypothetical protein
MEAVFGTVSQSDEDITKAISLVNIAQLRRLGQEGVRAESAISFHYAVSIGSALEVLHCLVEKLSADVNLTCTIRGPDGHIRRNTALHRTVVNDGDEVRGIPTAKPTASSCPTNLEVVQYLVKVLGADVNVLKLLDECKRTPLFIASQNGNLDIMRCLPKLGAAINQADDMGNGIAFTPLMVAAFGNHTDVVKWLVKAGANTTSQSGCGTAASISRRRDYSSEQTVYLVAKAHCSNPSCGGAGIKKCMGCKHARYCGKPCQLVHWKTHKIDCRRWYAELRLRVPPSMLSPATPANDTAIPTEDTATFCLCC